MMKKVLLSSLSAFVLLMSGCGGDSEGENYLALQKMLDKKDFVGVIDKLPKDSADADVNLMLGSAYMGKAGFTISNVISAFASSDSIGAGDAFSNYTKTIIGDNPSPNAFSDLSQASVYFTKVVNDACVSGKILSTSEQNVCLYMGLTLTTKAAETINLLTDNLSKLSTGEVDPKLKASVCAMQYTTAASKVDAECTLSPKGDVTFTQSQKTYGVLEITVNGEANDFLLTKNSPSTTLTVGYCPNNDFTARTTQKVPGYYPCPLNEDRNSKDTTTASVLVDTLNDGLGIVKTVAPSDVQSNVDEFKCDLIDGSFNGSSCSKTGKITEQVVIDFLNRNN